jgi:hypothetical protein
VFPSGKGIETRSKWLHEIKHDAFRVIARKKDAQVKGAVRNGYLLRGLRRSSAANTPASSSSD